VSCAEQSLGLPGQPLHELSAWDDIHEGFDTRDLKEAKALLEQLSS
jgi:hypothetical protein